MYKHGSSTINPMLVKGTYQIVLAVYLRAMAPPNNTRRISERETEKAPALSSIAYHFYGGSYRPLSSSTFDRLHCPTYDPLHSSAHTCLKGIMNRDLAVMEIQVSFTCNRRRYWWDLFSEEEVEEALDWARLIPRRVTNLASSVEQ